MANPPQDPHDAAFFEQMRQCREPYRRLADCFDAVVGKQESCLDIGCGIGLQTARLQELGWNAAGAEYSPYAIEMIEPGVTVTPLDLTQLHDGQTEGAWDCVICTETGEHIPAEHAMTVVRNVADRAQKFIIWSAAAPGQEWEGHINLQHPEYWLTRFRILGWDIDDDRTAKLRYLMSKTNAQHVLGKENFCVLTKARKPLHMTIVSTILNGKKWVRKHIESVVTQTFDNYTHYIIDAASDDGTADEAKQVRSGCWDVYREKLEIVRNDTRQSALENCWSIWKDLPDDEVIIWLDGDDWLAHDQALEIVARAYCASSEPWLTYGQFMFQDGGVGFASPYNPGAHARLDPVWRATHLKTFRAGLVKKLNVDDIKRPDGSWVDLAIDRTIMWPLLEMAGDRYTCIPQILSVYNYDASWAANRPADQLKTELDEVARLRGLTPYPALTKRPW